MLEDLHRFHHYIDPSLCDGRKEDCWKSTGSLCSVALVESRLGERKLYAHDLSFRFIHRLGVQSHEVSNDRPKF